MNENDGTPQEPKEIIKQRRIQRLRDWWAKPQNREKMKRQRNGRYEAILDAGERECLRCHKLKPLLEFPPGRKRRDGRARYAYCRSCHSEYQRIHRLTIGFNLSPEDYDRISAYQNRVCAICGRSPKQGKRLAVDHCHKTGLIRGALCWLCNRLLGQFRDDPERLKKAVRYLEDPPATRALGEARYSAPGRVGTKKRRKILAQMRESTK